MTNTSATINPLLVITDGTTTVSILNHRKGGGFFLKDWTPVIPEPKDGGVFASSPFSHGRRLVMRTYDNAIETFELGLGTDSQNNGIALMQEIRRLLEKAADYWLYPWNNSPVWIEARGSCEENTRYAVIVDFRLQNDDNPNAPPFFNYGVAAMDNLTLILERLDWTDQKPGYAGCLNANSSFPYGSFSDQVVKNGTFETADPGAPTFFYWTQWTDASGAVQMLGSPNQWAGDYCAGLMTEVPDSPTYIYQDCIVQPSTDYVLSFRTHAMDYAIDQSEGSYGIYDNTHAAWIKNLTSNGSLSETYYEVVWPFRVPAGCTSIRIYLYGSSIGGIVTDQNIVLYDNVSVTRKIPAFSGRANNCDGGLFVANKSQYNIGLQHIYHYDLSLASYSTNLMLSALPYYLWNLSNPAVGDFLYFGIETMVFSSLVFHLATSGYSNGVWQYYNGGGWVPIPNVRDNTYRSGQRLNKRGVYSVHWGVPTDWARVAINGVTAYWVRLTVSAPGLAGRAQQTSEQVYTVVNPYIDIDDDQVGGDLPALARAIISNVADCNAATSNAYEVFQLILSTRSRSRGDNFRPYLNFSHYGNPDAVTPVAIHARVSFLSYTPAPTGEVILFDPNADITNLNLAKIGISVPTVTEYIGDYRVFLRLRQEGGTANDFSVRMNVVMSGATVMYSEEKSIPILSSDLMLDMGILRTGQFLGNFVGNLSPYYLEFYILGSLTVAAAFGDLYFYDIILVPIDEHTYTFVSAPYHELAAGGPAYAENAALDIDSATRPKVPTMPRMLMQHSKAVAGDYDLQFGAWENRSSGAFVIPANTNTRLHVFMFGEPIQGMNYYRQEVCCSIQMWMTKRYLSMRGRR